MIQKRAECLGQHSVAEQVHLRKNELPNFGIDWQEVLLDENLHTRVSSLEKAEVFRSPAVFVGNKLRVPKIRLRYCGSVSDDPRPAADSCCNVPDDRCNESDGRGNESDECCNASDGRCEAAADASTRQMMAAMRLMTGAERQTVAAT